MKDYDAELKEICKKYGLKIGDYEIRCSEFLETFQEIFEKISELEPIAFYGMGEGFERMCARVDVCSKNVVCIVENNTDVSLDASRVPIINVGEVKKIPVTDISCADKYHFKKIILTGFVSRGGMKKDIKNINADIEIIDVYDILEKQGKKYREPFYIIEINDYANLQAIRRKYINSLNTDESQKYLKLLIEEYLECRDFICAGKYINEYVDNGYEDAESFAMLRGELKQFLYGIKKTLGMKNNKNIFVFVVDTLSYSKAMSVPYIKEISEKSFSFTNAFGPAFFTRGSTFGFLTGKNYVEDGLYKIVNISRNDSEFLTEMQDLGIGVKYISPAWLAHISRLKDDVYATANMISKLYWYLLMSIARESGDCIYFIHSLYETHIPFHSGLSSMDLPENNEMYRYFSAPGEAPAGYFEKLKILMEEALEYVESHLKFCIDLLPIDKDTVIITSDHDDRGYPEIFFGSPMTDDMRRIPLIINSKNIKPGKYEGLFSAVNMPSLLRQLIHGTSELEIEKVDYVRQEMEPHYSKAINLNAKESPWIYGKICFTTNTEQYNFSMNGDEWYFIKPDLTTNLIDDERYRERIDYFRSKIKLDTRDLWSYMFSKYPRLLEVHKERAEEFLNQNKNPNLRF